MVKCEDCKWWERISVDDFEDFMGFCRRRSPFLVAGLIREEDTPPDEVRWPVTPVNSWCGEFEPAKPPIQWKNIVLLIRRSSRPGGCVVRCLEKKGVNNIGTFLELSKETLWDTRFVGRVTLPILLCIQESVKKGLGYEEIAEELRRQKSRLRDNAVKEALGI